MTGEFANCCGRDAPIADDVELGGLDEFERRELLALLEERARREADFVDAREPLSAMVARDRQTLADATDDPRNFLLAWARHDEKFEEHLARLSAERPDHEDVCSYLNARFSDFDKAHELAAADGLPRPNADDFRVPTKKGLAAGS